MQFTALCLASSSKAATVVSECLEQLGWSIEIVVTVQQAVNAMKDDTFEALIVTLDEDSCHHDVSGESPMAKLPYLSKNLLKLAVTAAPSMLRLVYCSHVAATDGICKACIKYGADAVALTSESLETALRGLVTPPDIPLVANTGIESLTSSPANYTPLTTRQKREAQLLQISGGAMTRRVETIWRRTDQLERQVLFTPPEFTGAIKLHTNFPNQDATIRLVHVSDTHYQHRLLNVPRGDLFVHTGNFINYYSFEADHLTQFKDFLAWLDEKVCPHFEQVVFIAGNHDLLLDKVNQPRPAEFESARRILNGFLSSHPNVAYLENNSIVYRGQTIYGSPITFRDSHRFKTLALNRCMAFERKMDDHESLASSRKVKNIDILLTHRPPSVVLDEDCADQDGSYSLPVDCAYKRFAKEQYNPLPTRRLFSRHVCRRRSGCMFLARPPRLHAFGHNKKTFGMDYTFGTLMTNGSQERLLRDDKFGGGTPLVVTLPLRQPVSR